MCNDHSPLIGTLLGCGTVAILYVAYWLWAYPRELKQTMAFKDGAPFISTLLWLFFLYAALTVVWWLAIIIFYLSNL